ncbi:MAG: CIA30 family protein [Planctomycetota bacterium]
MCRQAVSTGPVTLFLLMVGSTLMAADEARVLFEFSTPGVAKDWRTVNDGVMGGVSDGCFKINEDKKMKFYGTLSLENNGGFASVRSRPTNLGIKSGDSIVARVRGDGREYRLSLHVPRSSGGYSYRQSFKTKKGEWTEVSFPVDKCVATYHGRVFPNQKLDPDEVNSVGFLLGDKKAGPFKLEVDWIKVRSGLAVAAAILVQRDITYVEAGHERHKLDVYAPTEGENHPVVFWIHGGGWQAGDKSRVQVKPQAFVDKGFVFASTNYRLLPDGTIKQMGEDVAKAIHWVHDHTVEYGGDPSRMFVMGHSAGAQLAALVCTDDRFIKAEGLSPSIIKGCVPVDGDTYDVPMQIATVEERIANIYRRKFGDEESQKDLSPVTHVAKGKYIPPVLILHVAEHPETKMQSQRLAKALQEAGISAKAYPAKGKDHRSINADLGLPDDEPTRVLFGFVDGALKK